MKQTVYGSFGTIRMAESALGALLDNGVKSEDISVIVHESHGDFARIDGPKTVEIRDVAEKGITTTTAGDSVAAMGIGAAAGLGIGALAGLASLFIPGVGLVIGGGALATALAGTAGTTVAGAISMGAYGFLKDQGVHEDVAQVYEATIHDGGAVLAVDVPSGLADEVTVRSILTKYGAEHLDTSAERTHVDQIRGGTSHGTVL